MALRESKVTDAEAARDAAQRLLRRHGLGNEPPIPVVGLANDLGLKVFRAPATDSDVSGMLVPEDGTYVIYVNAADAPVRRRFTIAHEIGHWELHRDQVGEGLVDRREHLELPTFQRAGAGTAQERAANAFAAELLMPAWLVKELSPNYDLETLARILHVSQAAMAIRLDELE